MLDFSNGNKVIFFEIACFVETRSLCALSLVKLPKLLHEMCKPELVFMFNDTT